MGSYCSIACLHTYYEKSMSRELTYIVRAKALTLSGKSPGGAATSYWLQQLHCQILRDVPNSSVVQQAVHSIVSLGSTIRFWKTKASPAIALTQSLFVAGSAAIEKIDRDNILRLLNNLYRCFGCGSVKTIREKFERK